MFHWLTNLICALSGDSDQAENVQRLKDMDPQFAEYVNVLPPALSGLIKIDETNMRNRLELLQSGKSRGNTSELSNSKMTLPPELESYQKDWSVGLLLGDASAQTNNNGSTIRLKMQQSQEHVAFLQGSCAVLYPYILKGIGKPGTKGNSVMQEMQTIQHANFNVLVPIFQDPSIPLEGKKNIQKKIGDTIGAHLSPVAISSWFCGDGGRADYTKNEGKGIHFHTQGFDFQSVENLSNGLRDRYGWRVAPKYDGVGSKGQRQYIVAVHSSSYDSFVYHVQPYILPAFYKRLPTPRKPKSRFRDPSFD